MAEKVISNMKGKLKLAYDSYSDDDEEDSRDCGLSLERLSLGQRKKKLLVLSLGGMLCHRVYRYDKSSVPKFRVPDTSYGSMFGK